MDETKMDIVIQKLKNVTDIWHYLKTYKNWLRIKYREIMHHNLSVK